MRVLISGLGSIGRKHINSIKSLYPGAEIVALRSGVNTDEYEGVKNIFDVKKTNLDSFDFVIISNLTSEHRKTIDLFIESGLPLFIEKPLHSNLEIEKSLSLINKKNIITYVACNLRFLDCIRYVKTQSPWFVDKLNEVNVYCGSYLPDWRPYLNFRESYSANPELGGGVHLDLIHELDYLYWFFGTPQKVCRNFKNQSSLKIESFDYAHYLLDYNSFYANVTLNYYRRDSKRYLEMVFENETWYIDLLRNEVSCNDKLIYSSDQKIADTYTEQMKYFINNLNSGAEMHNSINDGFNVLKICLS
jgi:predicted dehydrogenase